MSCFVKEESFRLSFQAISICQHSGNHIYYYYMMIFIVHIYMYQYSISKFNKQCSIVKT